MRIWCPNCEKDVDDTEELKGTCRYCGARWVMIREWDEINARYLWRDIYWED